jgi:4-amino-4-deoxychorismate lyase
MNDRMIKKEEVRISPFDHGYLYGLGLFETFRVYKGHCFLLDDHLKRLNDSLETLNINLKFERNEVEGKVKRLLAANGYDDAYIRLNVSAGNGEIGLQTNPYTQPVIIIFSKPLPPSSPLVEKEAVLLSIPRNTPEGSERLKSHHYLNNLFAKREIGDDPNKEGVFLTREGYLAEGIVSNLFWYKDGMLFTPSLNTGILNGITRQFIFTLAGKLELPVVEGRFLLKETEDAEEIFFTNSIQEIVAVSLFNQKRMAGKAGRLVRLLHKQYQDYSAFTYSRDEIDKGGFDNGDSK